MSSVIVLATQDTALADAWERQLPAGRVVLRLGKQTLPRSSAPGLTAVVVLDATCDSALPKTFAQCPTIFVGVPRSLPFEQARMEGRARVYLSYEESMSRLAELLPLVEEIAETQSLVELLKEKPHGNEPYCALARRPIADPAGLWELTEAAIENLDAKDRLVAEFKRAARQLLRASHVTFFQREADGFRADQKADFFAADDGLVTYFEKYPILVDGLVWKTAADPVAELAVRNRLALWGARLLVPVHDNGRLLGLIALGVREDGQAYDEMDRNRVIHLARLLRCALSKGEQVARLNRVAEQVELGAKYLPGTLVLGPDENPPRHVPLIVRELIGQTKRSQAACRAIPETQQPFRVSTGMIAETGGVWASWEEASREVQEAAAKERSTRRDILREIALTLSHELGNALMSLTTLRHAGPERPIPPSLVETAKDNILQLENLNSTLALMQSLHEAEPSPVDVREVAQEVGRSLGLKVEVAAEPVVLLGNRRLLDFALRALIQTVGENRPEFGLRELVLKVRSSGTGANLTALLSLKGKLLELEGILPEPQATAVPNQGRLSVFLAKEILRLHHGEIHAGPGIDGIEIQIALRHL